MNFGGISAGLGELKAGRAEFHNLTVGQYTVEVIAPGYAKLTETVNIQAPGQDERVLVTLSPESSAGTNNAPPEAPVLAPEAKKEFNKALEAIRENKTDEARKHLEKVSHVAPSNPDVDYLWGAYYSRTSDWKLAKSYWKKALQIYPRHVFSLAALGQLALREDDLPAAINYLGLAVEADPSSWRYQSILQTPSCSTMSPFRHRRMRNAPWSSARIVPTAHAWCLRELLSSETTRNVQSKRWRLFSLRSRPTHTRPKPGDCSTICSKLPLYHLTIQLRLRLRFQLRAPQ